MDHLCRRAQAGGWRRQGGRRRFRAPFCQPHDEVSQRAQSVVIAVNRSFSHQFAVGVVGVEAAYGGEVGAGLRVDQQTARLDAAADGSDPPRVLNFCPFNASRSVPA